MNNQDSGKGPKVKLLGGLLMLLAGWAIPEEEITVTLKWTSVLQKTNHLIR